MASAVFSEDLVRPLQNAPFCPISASGSNFTPRNIQYIPVVKIIAFLDFDQNWTFFKGLLVLLGIPEVLFSEEQRCVVQNQQSVFSACSLRGRGLKERF